MFLIVSIEWAATQLLSNWLDPFCKLDRGLPLREWLHQWGCRWGRLRMWTGCSWRCFPWCWVNNEIIIIIVGFRVPASLFVCVWLCTHATHSSGLSPFYLSASRGYSSLESTASTTQPCHVSTNWLHLPSACFKHLTCRSCDLSTSTTLRLLFITLLFLLLCFRSRSAVILSTLCFQIKPNATLEDVSVWPSHSPPWLSSPLESSYSVQLPWNLKTISQVLLSLLPSQLTELLIQTWLQSTCFLTD